MEIREGLNSFTLIHARSIGDIIIFGCPKTMDSSEAEENSTSNLILAVAAGTFLAVTVLLLAVICLY